MSGQELMCDGCGQQPAVEPCNLCGKDFCQDCLDSHDCVPVEA